jgi:hypothetical protein
MGATSALRLSRRILTAGLAVAVCGVGALFYAPAASAVTYSNACVNSAVPTNAAQVNVTLTGNVPASVEPGASFQLTNISQTLALPGAIFVAGYNLGLLVVGLNTVPGTIRTVIEGTNTVEGTQTTPVTAVAVTFTITDPDGVPGSGDETSTDAIVNANYPDQTWTAGPAGAIEFREDTVTPLSATVGGIVTTELIGGFLTIRFGCDPGTVGPGGLVGDIVLTDPAASFASTTSQTATATSTPTAATATPTPTATSTPTAATATPTATATSTPTAATATPTATATSTPTAATATPTPTATSTPTAATATPTATATSTPTAATATPTATATSTPTAATATPTVIGGGGGPAPDNVPTLSAGMLALLAIGLAAAAVLLIRRA